MITNDDLNKLEEKIRTIRKVLASIGTIIDNAPLPPKVKSALKKAVQNDSKLNDLLDGFEDHRAPRLMLVGSTGVGKSSFVNAICGSYVALVDDHASCTTETATFEITQGAVEDVLEILDTRGVFEGSAMEHSTQAEAALLDEVLKFNPDLLILLLEAKDRSKARRDQAEFVDSLVEQVAKHGMPKIPVLVVVNKCDAFARKKEIVDGQYSDATKHQIDKEASVVADNLRSWGLPAWPVVPVSSYLAWKKPDGTPVENEDTAAMDPAQRRELEIDEDGRYGIDNVLQFMQAQIVSPRARAGLILALRAQDVLAQFANSLTQIFASLAATVALSPIPISDIAVLTPLQILLVVLIGSLSGDELSWANAKKFITGVGGTVGAGILFRLVAQQAAKLLNLLAPGAGSAASSAIAYGGTVAIGKAAVRYYLQDESLEGVRRKFEAEKDESRHEDGSQ